MKKKFLLGVMVTGLCTVVSVDAARPPEGPSADLAVAIEDQPLKAKGMEALRLVFEQDPPAIGRIVTADTNVKIVLNALRKFYRLPAAKQKALEKKVAGRLGLVILAPVSPFLLLLRDFEWLCRPIVKEALDRADLDYEGSTLKAFMDAPRKQAATFFEKRNASTAELKKSCEELRVIFRGIEATFSKEFASEREKIKKAKEAKAKAKAKQNEGQEKPE